MVGAQGFLPARIATSSKAPALRARWRASRFAVCRSHPGIWPCIQRRWYRRTEKTRLGRPIWCQRGTKSSLPLDRDPVLAAKPRNRLINSAAWNWQLCHIVNIEKAGGAGSLERTRISRIPCYTGKKPGIFANLAKIAEFFGESIR